MIERKFVKHNVTENRIREYVFRALGRAGVSDIKLLLTPLGEKIVVFSSNPGLVVGKEGSNIKKLTSSLKKNFSLENPQIEISEVLNPYTESQIVADRIAGLLERYGTSNFKGVMHRAITDVLSAGVRGVEIVLAGKIPGSRAKRWRVLSGYMKKCGDLAVAEVRFARTTAKLKSGIIGIKVKIMPSGIILPDTVKIKEEEAKEIIIEEHNEAEKKLEEAQPHEKEEGKKKEVKKKAPRKPRKKKENDEESKAIGRTEQAGAEKQAE